jgi:hypothetical protein
MSNIISGGQQPLDQTQRAQTNFQPGIEQGWNENSLVDNFIPDDNTESAEKGRPYGLTSSAPQQYTIPNGTIEFDHQGRQTINLLNGLELKPDEEQPVVNDKVNNHSYPLKTEEEVTGKRIMKFTDVKGNNWQVSRDEFHIQVQNAAGTLNQTIDAHGNMLIEANNMSKDPELYMLGQNNIRVGVTNTGDISSVEADNMDVLLQASCKDGKLNLVSTNNASMGINLPYGVIGQGQGQNQGQGNEPSTDQSGSCGTNVQENQNELNLEETFFAPKFPPSQPENNSNCPCVLGSDQWDNGVMQGSGCDGSSDNLYNGIMSKNGIIKTQDAEGTCINLPNGVVVFEASDGTCAAVDHNAPEKTFPVQKMEYDDPAVGKEKVFQFYDSHGSHYSYYDKGNQLAVESDDQSVMQFIDNTGDMMIFAKSYGKDENGGVIFNTHKALVTNSGALENFGDEGISLTSRGIFVRGNGTAGNHILPYPIPSEQQHMSDIPELKYPLGGNNGCSLHPGDNLYDPCTGATGGTMQPVPDQGGMIQQTETLVNGINSPSRPMTTHEVNAALSETPMTPEFIDTMSILGMPELSGYAGPAGLLELPHMVEINKDPIIPGVTCVNEMMANNGQPGVGNNMGMNTQPGVGNNMGMNTQPGMANNMGMNTQPGMANNMGVNTQPGVTDNIGFNDKLNQAEALKRGIKSYNFPSMPSMHPYYHVSGSTLPSNPGFNTSFIPGLNYNTGNNPGNNNYYNTPTTPNNCQPYNHYHNHGGCQEPVKPGLFKKLKNFFTGGEDNNSPNCMNFLPPGNVPGQEQCQCGNPGNNNGYNNLPTPYPRDAQDVHLQNQIKYSNKMQTMMMGSMLMSSISSLMYPMAMFFSTNPSLAMGSLGMW